MVPLDFTANDELGLDNTVSLRVRLPLTRSHANGARITECAIC